MQPESEPHGASPVPAPAVVSPAAAAPAAHHFDSLTAFWGLSLTIVVLDQIAKALVRRYVPLYASVPVVPGLFDVVNVHNAGVAFGFLNEVAHPARGVITSILAVAALVGIGYYAKHVTREEWIARLGLSLILGGAVGNLTDRLWQGFVIDFMDVYWRGWHFWAFNVADSAITIGAALVFVELLFSDRHASHSL